MKDGEKYFRNRIEHDAVWVAILGDRIVGYVAGDLSVKKSYKTVQMAELENIFVEAAHRNQGIGVALVQAFLADCRKRGVAEIMVTAYTKNQAALEFYRRQGFIDFETTLSCSF